MNDSVSLTGLARQMVLAELLDEKTAGQAQGQAQRNKVSLVTYLVQNKLVKSRVLAELASDQFGVAFVDLQAIDFDVRAGEIVGPTFEDEKVFQAASAYEKAVGGWFRDGTSRPEV